MAERIEKEYAPLLDVTGRDIVEMLGVIAQSNIAHKNLDWASIQTMIANGSGPKAFSIGTWLMEKWADTAGQQEYEMPWRVNHFENGELIDGTVTPIMWLQTHYTLPFGVQFSRRAFLACPEGLEVGTYHFDFAEKWGNNVAPGIKYQFTLTKPVEKGGRVAGCFSAPDVNPTSWKVYSYGKDGITLNETVNVTAGSDGTNLGTLQANRRNGNLNSFQEMAYGHNRWKTSAIRQYLNSKQPKTKWWVPQDEWDICPEQLATKDGFLCGMPEEMLATIKPVKVVTYANTVNDEGVEDITYDYVTLPSLEQMFITPQVNGEGKTHDYWRLRSGEAKPLAYYKTYPNMISFSVANKSSAQYVRLRSAYRYAACHAWYVYASGSIVNGYATYASAFSPLVAIG